ARPQAQAAERAAAARRLAPRACLQGARQGAARRAHLGRDGAGLLVVRLVEGRARARLRGARSGRDARRDHPRSAYAYDLRRAAGRRPCIPPVEEGGMRMRHGRWKWWLGCALVGALAMPLRSHADQATSLPEQMETIAEEAYVYGYPLVLLDVTAKAATN